MAKAKGPEPLEVAPIVAAVVVPLAFFVCPPITRNVERREDLWRLTGSNLRRLAVARGVCVCVCVRYVAARRGLSLISAKGWQ